MLSLWVMVHIDTSNEIQLSMNSTLNLLDLIRSYIALSINLLSKGDNDETNEEVS